MLSQTTRIRDTSVQDSLHMEAWSAAQHTRYASGISLAEDLLKTEVLLFLWLVSHLRNEIRTKKKEMCSGTVFLRFCAAEAETLAAFCDYQHEIHLKDLPVGGSSKQ